MKRRRWAPGAGIVLVAGVLAIAVAGCGGGDDAAGDTSETPATTAAEATTEAPAATTEATTAATTEEAASTDVASQLQQAIEDGSLPSLEGKKIAYIQTSSVEYFEQSKAGACGAVEALGGECIALNSNYEPETEVKNVQDAITQGVDGIMLFSISQATFESSSRLAEQAGIPIVDFYGWFEAEPEDAVAFLGADAYQAGLLDGQGLVEALGECDGCPVAQVQGQLGRGEVEDYARGFEEVATEAGYKIVDKPTSHWSRQEALARMQELLQKYPDLAGVFCHNDDTAVGCIQAIRQAGKQAGDIKVVTLNGSSTGLDLLEQGWLQADVGWSPAEEGAMAARLLAEAVNGESNENPFPCHPPLTLLTPDNIADAESWVPNDELIADWLLNSECQT